jgi:hypothetical protein
MQRYPLRSLVAALALAAVLAFVSAAEAATSP